MLELPRATSESGLFASGNSKLSIPLPSTHAASVRTRSVLAPTNSPTYVQSAPSTFMSWFTKVRKNSVPIVSDTRLASVRNCCRSPVDSVREVGRGFGFIISILQVSSRQRRIIRRVITDLTAAARIVAVFHLILSPKFAVGHSMLLDGTSNANTGQQSKMLK